MASLLRRCLTVTLVSICACAGSSPPSPSPPISSASSLPSASASAAAPAPAIAFVAALPAGAILTASLDLTRLDVPALATLADPPRALRDALRIVDGERSSEWLAANGVDASRPIEIALAPPSADIARVAALLRPLVPATSPESDPKSAAAAKVADRLRAACASLPTLASHRVLVPVTDAKRARSAVATIFGAMGWTATHDEAFTSGDVRAEITGDAATLAIDVAIGDDPRAGIFALREAARASHVEAPRLRDETLRLAYAPRDLAELGFVTGARAIERALGSDGIDASQLERLAREGLWESGQALLLATGARGARFEQIDLAIAADRDHPRITLRALAGPGFDGPSDDAYAPTFTIGGGAVVDVSRPFVEAWSVIGGRSAGAGDGALNAIRDAGWPGDLIAIADLVVAMTARAASSGPAPSRAVLERLSRWIAVRSGHAAIPDVFVGVFPDGTTRAAAECVLAGATPCGTKRLRLGDVGVDGAAHVRVTELDHHYLLIRARDAALLTPKLVASVAPPLRVEIDPREVLDPLPTASFLAPGPLVATLRREGRAIVFELARR